jgi:hypothetical protein
VQVGNRPDMLKELSKSLETPEAQECEMMVLAMAEEQALEDDTGC